MRRLPVFLLTVSTTLLVLTGCASDSPAAPDPEPGNIEVTVTTTGVDVDSDGYLVEANGVTMSLAVNGSATYADLVPGTYAVSLSGVADNCEVTSDNPLSVTVASQQTVTASLTVVCTRIQGPMTLVGADEDGNIYTVDEVSGVATLHLDTSTDDGTGTLVDVGVVSSMIYVVQTDQWWLGTGGQAQCEGCIQTLDPATGVATTLYDFDPTRRQGVSGLAVHPTSDRIFSFESDSSSDLYELDPVTGVFTVIANTLAVNSAGKGTTFTLAGDFYVVGDGDLFSVDLDLNASSFVATLTFSGFPAFQSCCRQDMQAMATRPTDGTIFGLLRDGSRRNAYGTYLITLDVMTGVTTLVGETLVNLEGLAYVPTSMINP